MTLIRHYTKLSMLAGVLILAGFLWGQSVSSTLAFRTLVSQLESQLWTTGLMNPIDATNTIFTVSAMPILTVIQ